MYGNRKSYDPFAIRSARDRYRAPENWPATKPGWRSYRISLDIFLSPYLRSPLLFFLSLSVSFFFSPPLVQVSLVVHIDATARCAGDAELFTNFKGRC